MPVPRSRYALLNRTLELYPFPEGRLGAVMTYLERLIDDGNGKRRRVVRISKVSTRDYPRLDRGVVVGVIDNT